MDIIACSYITWGIKRSDNKS